MIDIELIKKAIKLTQEKKYSEAENVYKVLLEENPDNPDVLSVLGLFYVNVLDYDKAIEILKKAVDLKRTFGTVSALGFAYYEKADYEKAAEILESALELGANVDIYNKLILSLFEIHKYKKAIEFSDKIYESYSEDVRAIACKVKALTQSGKMLEAEKLCVESLKKTPDASNLWFHLGYLKELIYCNDRQAKECYKAAAELGNPEAFYNIAVSAQKLGEKDEAEKYYKIMLRFFPDNEEAKVSLGMLYLSQKKFKEGYDLFFQRKLGPSCSVSKNFWKVGDIIQDEVNVICEQGLGDHIQFSRYLPLIPAKKINVATPKPLQEIFRQSFENVNFINYEEVNPELQAMRITDLAYILGIDFDNIPSGEGYLKSQVADIENNKLKVGLCWEAGSAAIRTMINRTINIKCFEPLMNLANIQIYSFQVDDTLNGCEQYPQMINLGKDFKNFSDTAKALKAMDVLVTVDTSVAHLAGALGVKTYLLLPYATDWRWFDDTKTTPWYDSVEIFKQTDSISWEEPINRIIEKLNYCS